MTDQAMRSTTTVDSSTADLIAQMRDEMSRTLKEVMWLEEVTPGSWALAVSEPVLAVAVNEALGSRH